MAAELNRIYLAKGVLATTAIEGNTLTEEDALAALTNDLRLPKSKDYLRVEIENVIKACNEIAQDGINEEITVELLRKYNRTILDGLVNE